ncbi:MAG: endonuclease/exonuclease/phosphatase family protein [Oscillospiraceae bacterium]|nr:endonuclease/exonuclease/phosphatase family protein [Oscillospiraceae bacterium]
MNRWLKRILMYLAGLVLLVLLFVVAYVVYMQVNYYRIDDNTALEITNPSDEVLKSGVSYKALTYNIGFGAYNHDFSFFMDSGTMLDGTPVSGTMSRAQSKEIELSNTEGALGAAKLQDADFYLMQEVDTKSTRSFKIDQRSVIESAYPDYSDVYGVNFHSSYLLYPFSEPHGSVLSGLLTLSRYSVGEAVRRSYPVDTSFFTKFFDLDRCFVLLRLPVDNGKELVLVNSHMSAYDEGGTIRAQQLDMLNQIMAEEYAKGNYVIVGGDFNHALCDTINAFASQQEVPNWVFPLDDSDISEGLSVVRADNVNDVPTCRSTDMPYEKGVNYSVVIDGFIVSDNVTASAVNIDTDFDFSDHNPVLLTFTLN